MGSSDFFEATRCYFCGADTYDVVSSFKSSDMDRINQRLLHQGRTPIAPSDSGLRVVRCRSCDLTYQNPRPTQALLQFFYDEVYAPSGTREEDFKSYSFKSLAQERSRLEELQRWRRPPGKLLDVGCGNGYFLMTVQEAGWTAFGTEYSRTAAAQARAQPGLTVFEGDLAQAPFPNDFDVITMNSVLEHVLNPQELLKTCEAKLREGGLLIFNVPNTSSWELKLAHLLVGSRYGWYTLEHLHYYSPQFLKKTLPALGFHIVQMSSRHDSYDPYLASSSASDATVSLKASLFKKVLQAMKWFLERTSLGGRLLKGNIVYVVARKGNAS